MLCKALIVAARAAHFARVLRKVQLEIGSRVIQGSGMKSASLEPKRSLNPRSPV